MLSLPLAHFGFSPVKGTRHTAQQRAYLGPGGIELNRRWGLVLPKTGQVLRTVAHPSLMQVETFLEDGSGQVALALQVPGQGSFTVEPLPVDPAQVFDFWGKPKRLALYEHPVNAALSDFLGKEAALAYALDPLIYGAPLSIIGTATLEDISRRLGQPVDPERFRANLLVETTQPYIEDTWGGQTLVLRATEAVPGELDGVRLMIGQPIGRCAVINANPHTGVRDLPLLKSLASFRPWNKRGEPTAGVYAVLAAS